VPGNVTIAPISNTSFKVGWISGSVEFPNKTLSIIVKGTFDLYNDSFVVLSESQDELLGDEYLGDDLTSSLKLQSDFVYFKPRTDLSLNGRCYTPGNQARKSCRITFKVGETEHALMVFGERYWEQNSEGFYKISDPDPFTELELCYENSFGGESYGSNPVGKGNWGDFDEVDKRHCFLPAIEAPGYLIRSIKDRPKPAGFGPLNNAWQQRMEKVGTYDDKWLEKRWPWFPEDFDWSYFNSAPEELQVSGYLNGDEDLYFENLHPEFSQYRSQLPGLKIRSFLHGQAGIDSDSTHFREVPMNLDTLSVDMEKEQLVLVWRGVGEVISDELEGIENIFVFSEPLNTPPVTRDAAYKLFQKQLAPEQEMKTPEPEAKIDVEAEITRDEAEMRDELKKAGLDPSMLDTPPSRKQMIAETRSMLKQQYTALGMNPSRADEWEPPPDESERMQKEFMKEYGIEFPEFEVQEALTRTQCLDLIAQGESLAGKDLSGIDLSNLNLQKIDFAGAIMVGSNLTGSDLSMSIFENANLSDGVLNNANMKGADLSASDLSHTQLIGANLTGAILSYANFENANLSDARMVGVVAERTVFIKADLSNANMSSANMLEADFSDSSMEKANLQKANLHAATMEGVKASDIDMREAVLTEANMSEESDFSRGCFVNVVAAESTWINAILQGSNFSGAQLSMADFSSALMQRSDLWRANMPGARLSMANLEDARLAQANLFQGSLEKANLIRADLRDANMYEVEFRDAVMFETLLDGANVHMSKLET
jgi:uncharacterized protein YjbI with pentapeptide repeats